MAKSKFQFGKKERVNYEEVDTIVGSDITFIGDLASGGNVRYEGNLKGNVNLQGNIIVGRNALIAGNITAKNVHIIGTVEGIVTCEHLKVLSTGKLTGDVYVDNVTIDEGAIFIGKCKTKEEKQAEEEAKKQAIIDAAPTVREAVVPKEKIIPVEDVLPRKTRQEKSSIEEENIVVSTKAKPRRNTSNLGRTINQVNKQTARPTRKNTGVKSATSPINRNKVKQRVKTTRNISK